MASKRQIDLTARRVAAHTGMPLQIAYQGRGVAMRGRVSLAGVRPVSPLLHLPALLIWLDAFGEGYGHRPRPARANPAPSRYPTTVKRCILHVVGRETNGTRPPTAGDVRKAFAVCVSGAQKGGSLKKGTRVLTHRGAGRQARYTPEERLAADLEYESLLAMTRKPRPRR